MRGETDDPRQQAVLLRGDEIGVATEGTPRKIQRRNGTDDSYSCSLRADWLDQLGIAEQSAATLHSFTVGVKPVIVQHPAIIIQPMDVLQETGGDEL